MLVRELMTKNIVHVSPEDTVREAISKMKKNRIHQLPVIDDSMCGMLTLKNIVTRGSDLNTKAKNISINVPSIDADKNAEEAATFLLRTGMKAVPVYDKEKLVGIISETDLAKAVKTDKKASDVASRAVTIEKDGNVGSIKNLMVSKNISRIPVVEKNEVLGIVGTMELLKILEANKTYEARISSLGGHDSKEKMSAEETEAMAIMKTPAVVNGDASIKDVVNLMQKSEEVIVRGDFVGIITPKDIIELLARPPENEVLVQIANIGDEDDVDIEKVHQTAQSFINKIKMSRPEFLIIHLDRYNKGGKTRYVIKTRMSAHIGLFVSEASEWNIITSVQESLNKLEREVKKKYGKIIDHSKKKGRRS